MNLAGNTNVVAALMKANNPNWTVAGCDELNVVVMYCRFSPGGVKVFDTAGFHLVV